MEQPAFSNFVTKKNILATESKKKKLGGLAPLKRGKARSL
jgi:hypothetical protein